MSVQQLNNETVHLICSTQVITSVHGVVKELVENSLDAKATSIEVKLENYGIDLIEVKDNGCGIKREDVPNVTRAHCTSKLSSFNDLQSLETYGFRGEALTSVAAVSNLSITTCTVEDEHAMMYMVNNAGEITSTHPSHIATGTTVSVKNLFKNVPVRKLCYKSSKRCKEELKKVEDVLLAFGISHSSVRFVLKHNKSIVWQKEQATDLKSNILLVFGSALFQKLSPLCYQCFNPMVKLRAYIPKPGVDDVATVSRSTPDRIFVLVNQRVVTMKPVIQLVRQKFVEAFPSQAGRYPIAVVMISVPPCDIDVNLDPNKTAVLLHHMDFVLTALESLCTQFYAPSKLNVAQSTAQSTTTKSEKKTQSEIVHEKDTSSSVSKSSPKKREAVDSLQSSHFDNSCDNRENGERTNNETSLEKGVDVNPADNEEAKKGPGSRELLDISELEQELSMSEQEMESFSGDLSPSSKESEVIQSDSHLAACPSSNQVTLSQWSRGEALDHMEPVKLLQRSAAQTVTPTHTITQIQSKLNDRGPSPIFDLINNKPVKRKASSSPSQLEHSISSKRQKQLPALLEKLVKDQEESAMEIPTEKVCFELQGIVVRSKALASRSLPSERKDRMIGYCDPPGVWLVLYDNRIATFNATCGHDSSSSLSTMSRADVEGLYQDIVSCDNIEHYLHNIYAIE